VGTLANNGSTIHKPSVAGDESDDDSKSATKLSATATHIREMHFF